MQNEEELDVPLDADLGQRPMTAAPTLPTAMYWDYLEALDLDDAAKTTLLETLWAMMVQLVELGFTGDPLPHLLPPLVRAAEAEELMATEKEYFSQFKRAARTPKPGGCA